jgi:hypothetical protein
MKLKRASIILLLTIAAIAVCRLQARWVPTEHWFAEPRIYERPKKGYVPTKDVAIDVGRAVIRGAYGAKFGKELEPLDARLFGDVWVVYSYFPDDGTVKGGVTTVEISKTSGSVLSLRSER